jgi:hypothetical protein
MAEKHQRLSIQIKFGTKDRFPDSLEKQKQRSRGSSKHAVGPDSNPSFGNGAVRLGVCIVLHLHSRIRLAFENLNVKHLLWDSRTAAAFSNPKQRKHDCHQHRPQYLDRHSITFTEQAPSQ